MSADAHQSEYVADRDQAIKYISGFSGSAGGISHETVNLVLSQGTVCAMVKLYRGKDEKCHIQNDGGGVRAQRFNRAAPS